MSVEIRCPECDSLLRVTDLSRKARCPSCSHVFDPQQTAGAGADAAQTPTSSLNDAGPSASYRSNDPYAPNPSFPDVQPNAPADWSLQTINAGDVLADAWAVFKKHWAMVIVVVIIVGAINTVGQVLQSGANAVFVEGLNAPELGFVVQMGFGLVFWVLNIWVQIGQMIVMLDIVRGRPVEIGKVFGGGPMLLHTLIATFLITVLISAILVGLVGIPAVVGGVVMQAGEGAAVGAVGGFLFAVIPIIIVSIMFSQIQPIIIDRRVNAIEAMRLSYRLTDGNKGNLFILSLMMFGLGIAAFIVGLLALCVGVIATMVAFGGYTAVVLAVVYLSMSGQPMSIPRD